MGTVTASRTQFSRCCPAFSSLFFDASSVVINHPLVYYIVQCTRTLHRRRNKNLNKDRRRTCSGRAFVQYNRTRTARIVRTVYTCSNRVCVRLLCAVSVFSVLTCTYEPPPPPSPGRYYIINQLRMLYCRKVKADITHNNNNACARIPRPPGDDYRGKIYGGRVARDDTLQCRGGLMHNANARCKRNQLRCGRKGAGVQGHTIKAEGFGRRVKKYFCYCRRTRDALFERAYTECPVY